MFCRSASFFSFFHYNRHHFLSEGGEVMESKKVKKILNRFGVQAVFRDIPEYYGLILSKIFQVPLKQIMDNMDCSPYLSEDFLDKFELLLKEYIFAFSCVHSDFEKKILKNGESCDNINVSNYLFKKKAIKNVDSVLVNLEYKDTTEIPKEFYSKSERSKDDDYIFASYYFNMNYLFHCDINVVKDPKNLEYYFHPLVCYDETILNEIYKDDSLMMEVVKYVQELYNNPYIIECSL